MSADWSKLRMAASLAAIDHNALYPRQTFIRSQQEEAVVNTNRSPADAKGSILPAFALQLADKMHAFGIVHREIERQRRLQPKHSHTDAATTTLVR